MSFVVFIVAFVSNQVNQITPWLHVYLWRGVLAYTWCRSNLDGVDGRYSRLSSRYGTNCLLTLFIVTLFLPFFLFCLFSTLILQPCHGLDSYSPVSQRYKCNPKPDNNSLNFTSRFWAILYLDLVICKFYNVDIYCAQAYTNP